MAITRQKDYLSLSIVSMLFCFCPLGLAALIFSLKSRDASNQNDPDTAAKHSKTAYHLNIAAMVVGIILIIIVVIANIVVVSS
ncbi:dispanin subfamily A member 2b-like [Bufo gargarizans]|uniref:dispanin subfamily A member 2b-like n=1 Tax=Bufo gargarizans TaxID=30331 RepID=UPI001CF136F3|nr:dispanin subfamily A member 2b-like [Bufo gargarizans]XP_044140862.1 dispanin subfamily A member 2b-like [Bufo gargarizans]